MAYIPILKVINNTGAVVTITDAGVVIPASSFDTFTDDSLVRQLATSKSIRTLVGAGTLTLNDGSTNIPIWQADSFLLNFLLIGASGRQINMPTITAGAYWFTNIGHLWIDSFGSPWGYQGF